MAARWLAMAALLPAATGYAPRAPRRRATVVKMSDDSWAQEMAQAGGGFELAEASRWKKSDRGKADAESRGRNDAILKWLEDNGVWVSELSGWNEPPHSLALATSTFDELEGEDSGRGLLARRAIAQDGIIARLPVRLCMTKQAALEAKELRGIVTEDTNEYVAIALLLIGERAKAATSFWNDYITVLPSVADVAATFTWDEEELKFLEGSPARQATRSMQEKLQREHASILAQFPSLDPAVFSFEAWTWAFSNLFSRAIRLKAQTANEFLALVPYIDFINHSPFSSSYVDARAIPKAFPWEAEDDEVVLFSDRAYKQFDQIFISYGPRPNSDLLLLYGFALDRNPFNSVDLVVGANADADPLFAQKQAFAAAVGRDAARAAFPLYADRYPDELVQFLRMACATQQHLGNLELAAPESYVDIVSLDNELAVLETIREAATGALAAYPPFGDIPAAFLSRNQRMARRLVQTEQRILQKTVAATERKTRELQAAPPGFKRREPDILSNFK